MAEQKQPLEPNLQKPHGRRDPDNPAGKLILRRSEEHPTLN